MIHPLVRLLLRFDSGRACRRCTEPIAYADPFGKSEGVCAGCRS